jgi:hypothetical protein
MPVVNNQTQNIQKRHARKGSKNSASKSKNLLGRKKKGKNKDTARSQNVPATEQRPTAPTAPDSNEQQKNQKQSSTIENPTALPPALPDAIPNNPTKESTQNPSELPPEIPNNPEPAPQQPQQEESSIPNSSGDDQTVNVPQPLPPFDPTVTISETIGASAENAFSPIPLIIGSVLSVLVVGILIVGAVFIRKRQSQRNLPFGHEAKRASRRASKSVSDNEAGIVSTVFNKSSEVLASGKDFLDNLGVINAETVDNLISYLPFWSKNEKQPVGNQGMRGKEKFVSQTSIGDVEDYIPPPEEYEYQTRRVSIAESIDSMLTDIESDMELRKSGVEFRYSTDSMGPQMPKASHHSVYSDGSALNGAAARDRFNSVYSRGSEINSLYIKNDLQDNQARLPTLEE